jgi:RNA-directed DNA polymerase
VSSEVFLSLDAYVWRLLYVWARWGHRNKPGHRVGARYFGKFNKFRNDHWVFGDRDSGGYLVRFSWNGIERYVPVRARHPPMTLP